MDKKVARDIISSLMASNAVVTWKAAQQLFEIGGHVLPDIGGPYEENSPILLRWDGELIRPELSRLEDRPVVSLLNSEGMMDTMQFDKVGALMFYDKDNTLVGSIGMEPGEYKDEEVRSIADGALVNVFSTEEAARIAYFTTGEHYLVHHEGITTEPTAQLGNTFAYGLAETAPSSYTQALMEHGLFEKDFYIKHKLELFRTLQRGDSLIQQHSEEQSLIVRSLMKDLGIDVEEIEAAERNPTEI
ncbi:hypothetical protein [Paenibacillus sp. NPDC057934]|uniref:hypothetical protein n=1 Tax=Paenibacillus sp. NPDC057934 TaxID=3346282 RepID=UPI0036D78B51